MGPCRSELGACCLGEAPQVLGLARLGLEIRGEAPGEVDLGVDVDLCDDGRVRARPGPRALRVRGERLGGVTLVRSGHIGSGDRDEVRGWALRSVRAVRIRQRSLLRPRRVKGRAG